MTPVDRRTWLLLGLILLIATAVRCWHLGAQSLWLDECYTLECAFGHDYGHMHVPRNAPISPAPDWTSPAHAHPWWQIPVRLTRDLHPPLPYLMTRGWVAMFGTSEKALRSLSLVASLATIVLLFAIARMLHGNAVALWACLIMALAGPQIDYAQEAKHYALLGTWALVACFFIVSIEQRGPGRGRAIGLLLAALGALFTHYYFVAPLAALFAYAILRLRDRGRRQALAALVAATALFAIAWGPAIVHQRSHANQDMGYLRDNAPGGPLPRGLARAAAVPVLLLDEPPAEHRTAAVIAGVMIYAAAAITLRRRPDVLLWAIWLPAVVALPLAIDLARNTWGLAMIRYTLVAGPAVYCLLAIIGLAWVPRSRWVRHAVPLAVVLSCLAALPHVYTPWRPDWRTLGRQLAARAGPDDAIVYASDSDPVFLPTVYFLCTSHYANPTRATVFLLDRPADAQLRDKLRGYRHVWLVTDGSEPGALDPDAAIESMKTVPLTGAILGLRLTPSSTGPATAPR
jgi:hypothetical protein